ncbi:MAG: hypothetical protein ACERLM_15180, partial [Acidimicrobiales bacterium]
LAGCFAMTKETTTRFREPVRVGLPYEVRARIVAYEGHEIECRAEILDEAIARLADCEWDADVLSEIILGFSDRFEINKKRSQMPVRVAVTGRSAGPPLWQSLIELGRDEVLARLRSARARL